ncbi:NADPH-dependent FMN reductase [Rufibacter glacialis]|uniref:NAD(P)H-dependent oxidoreductase n=1 Tax=Rufibacter glacialis TaxID=1259555 RepID=A0A5M8QU63_9BACT|nr:NAD(P)H-dependent oxidoreductase [Rufibacter glacialis]KAA6438176.1 NAD(P)H-dependent oxidoreductase [Rufibacter glacialis]GGK89248.1 NADPH-dependent FMN reductase [Rufibacter glacialis]
METYRIAVFVGSLRKESYNLKTAKVLMALAPDSLSLDLVRIADLPMFNEDLEDNPPQEWLDLREQIQAADGLLFLTPEYNRSVPGALKNALDIGSRPYGKNSWNGKPGAVVSVSIGNISGFGANHHLRQSLVFVNVPTMAQPEAYLGDAAALFDEAGNLTNDSTKEFLRTFMEAYGKWVATNAKQRTA